MLQCDSYLIDRDTLALVSVFVDGYRTRIMTRHGVYHSKMSIEYLLEESCIRNASTFDGRIRAIRKIMEYPKKTPLLIDTEEEVGAFPTLSSIHVECVWIFNHHFHVNVLSCNTSEVVFDNGMSLQVKTSKHVLINQQQRLYSTMEVYRSKRRNMIYIERPRTVQN
ncbi:competence protein ComK [Paenisporosarcina sp. TG20]|uniref:competence protein ComK n=1 Tax=Paenisporosarcina sp. TG20 TaxID=1211706 RepID=UPI0002EC1778|nr:competence protein ComK [Paenisporosarcina sp. TG20]